VSAHLLTQGAKSEKLEGSLDVTSCMYRGPEGRKCAVGILIPDEVYTSDMEYHTIITLLRDHGDVLPEFFKEHYRLLCALQIVHDAWPVDNWRSQLNHVATRYGLTGVAEEAI
jgi:hypothetical protein